MGDLCTRHGRRLRGYCKLCSEPACTECLIAYHYNHHDSVHSLSEYAEEVKQELVQLIELASNLPFRRIQFAAEKTRNIAMSRKDDLLRKVESSAKREAGDIQNSLDDLDAMKQGLFDIGEGFLQEPVDDHSGHTRARQYLDEVGTLLNTLDDSSTPSWDIDLKFVGMRPDGSIGDFIKGKFNFVCNVVDEEDIAFIADNRKFNNVIMIGRGDKNPTDVVKWVRSFCTANKNQIVCSSRIRREGQQRFLLIAIGNVIYKVDVSQGPCIADQIHTIFLKEEIIKQEEAFSVTGIDWFQEGNKSVAVLSLNTVKSLYLIDTETRTLVRTYSTVLVNPTVMSNRQVSNLNLTIVRNVTNKSTVVVVNQDGKEEFFIHPSKEVTDYIPWVSCWLEDASSIKIAVVWCRPMTNHWRIMIHNESGKVIRELEEYANTEIPISIAYSPAQEIFVVCSKGGIHLYPNIPK